MKKDTKLAIVFLMILVLAAGYIMGFAMAKGNYFMVNLERNYYKDQFYDTCTLSNTISRMYNNQSSEIYGNGAFHIKELNCEKLLLR